MSIGISGNTHAGRKRANVIEGVAISASMLCLAHCLALPLLLVLLPAAIGLLAGSEAFHLVALALVAPAALAAFSLGYSHHRALGPALMGAVGIVSLFAAVLPDLSREAEIWLTVAGSLLLVAGHVLNWRLRSRAV